MESTNEVRLWTIVSVTVCIFTATVAGCNGVINYHDDMSMVDMVAKGVDPQDARCAIKGSSERSECAIRAATKNK